MARTQSRSSALLPEAVWPFAFAVLVFIVTDLPYLGGRLGAPDGLQFAGQVHLLSDINAYFSFIRQSADGHWLFINRLTQLPHAAFFFNLQWLLLGKAMRWFHLSDATAFEMWRAAGIVVLILGFSALAKIVLAHPLERRVALLLFAFGGGFAWFIEALRKIGLVPVLEEGPWPHFMLELSLGLHPFFQMMINPHFSLPHGLLLFSFALFLKGEREGRARWYFATALTVFITGALRPYDVITLWVALPLFSLTSPERFDLKRTLLRAIPLLATAPLLTYHAFSFFVHPIFKFWASQAEIAPVRVSDHVLSLGLAGVLFAGRLYRVRAFPLTSAERFLVAWTLCLFTLVHLRKAIASFHFSPQLTVSTMAPLVLLAVPILGIRGEKSSRTLWSRPPWTVALLVVINSLSSAVLTRQVLERVTTQQRYYVTRSELDAFAWLNAHAQESDVILSDRGSGNRLGRYVSARVVVGHYALTPRLEETEAQVEAFFSGSLEAAEARSYLTALRVHWIFVRDVERKPDDLRLKRIPGCEKRYQAGSVAIYSFQPSPT